MKHVAMSRFDRILFAGSVVLLLATASATTAQTAAVPKSQADQPNAAADTPANVLTPVNGGVLTWRSTEL